jgi:hypothetical protein
MLQSTGLEIIWRVHLKFIKLYVILKSGKGKVAPVQDMEVVWREWRFRTG